MGVVNFVQIIHTRRNHWIVASTVNSKGQLHTQVCYVRKQGGLFTYNTIVYITITLFTLEGISRNGHMKSPTKRLKT